MKDDIKKFEQFQLINESNSYTRVIPRDFFNESKLLKCMGRLALLRLDNQLPDGIEIEIDEHGEPFDIKQDMNSGSIYVSNYSTSVNDIDVIFATRLNSKEPYPMVCIIGYDEVEVFDNDGDFVEEFIEYFRTESIEESKTELRNGTYLYGVLKGDEIVDEVTAINIIDAYKKYHNIENDVIVKVNRMRDKILDSKIYKQYHIFTEDNITKSSYFIKLENG